LLSQCCTMAAMYRSVRRFASRKQAKTKSNANIAKSAAIASLIDSSQTQSLQAFQEAYGEIKSVEEAYEIQRGVATILESEYDDKYQRQGYKVGGTASNIKSIWGISDPFLSPLYSVWHCVANHAVEKQKELTRGVECEFVFKIGATLDPQHLNAQTTNLSLDDIYPLVECVLPGFELIDPRIVYDANIGRDDEQYNTANFKIPIEYLIADLCWTGGIVVGSESRLNDLGYVSWKEYDEQELREAAVEVYLNGDQMGIGYGREVLGSPFNSLLHLYNELLKQGQTIREGEYVSTGTCTGNTFLKEKDSVEGVFENIGDVELKLL